MQKNRIKLILDERIKLGKTWEELSEGLPISGNSLRMAFTRNSVNKVYLEHVESKLKINTETQHKNTKNTLTTSNSFLEKDGVTFSLEEVLLEIAKNEDLCMKEKIFSNIIEIRVAKRISEITASEEKLKEYLKN